MSKIQRTTQKIFGGNAPGDSMAVFGSMKTGTPIYTDNIEDLQSEAYGKAWEASIVADEAPFLEEMNGVQYGFSKQIAYLLQSGMPEYDPGTEYYKGDWCKGINPSGTNSIFESLTDNNVGNALTDTTNWKELDFASGGSGLPIGFIGTCAFGIDESRGLARYLNGSIMAINANTQGFVDKLSAAAKLYPSLLCTEEQWQATVTLSAFGQCGQFVLDETAGTVRLPKIITPIQGLTDLASLGELVEAGLPNIEGNFTRVFCSGGSSSGAFTRSIDRQENIQGSSDPYIETLDNFTFNASLSNPIYGKSDTVQPEAVQYPYFIQVATGVEEEVSITNTFEINNPYTLLQPLWSDKKLNNLSWLRSNGQSNPKAEYQTVYDLILEEYNSAADETETVGGVEITFRRGALTGMKVTTDKSAFDSILEAMGTAWYYVIDTANEVFYLPQSDGFMQFGGNGEFVEAGLPNIKGNFNPSDGMNTTSAGCFYDSKGKGYAEGSGTPNSSYGYHTFLFDASRSSAVYGKSETVQPNAVKGYLYFYVGETIQNANIVNIGRLEEQLIEKTTPAQAAHAAMPSDRYIDLSLGKSGSTYTAPADGYFYLDKITGTIDSYVNILNTSNSMCAHQSNGASVLHCRVFLPVLSGETVTITYNATGATIVFRFIYAQGVQ